LKNLRNKKMKKYEDVSFESIRDGVFRIVWPSGLKSTIKADSEAGLLKKIKEMKIEFSKKV